MPGSSKQGLKLEMGQEPVEYIRLLSQSSSSNLVCKSKCLGKGFSNQAGINEVLGRRRIHPAAHFRDEVTHLLPLGGTKVVACLAVSRDTYRVAEHFCALRPN